MNKVILRNNKDKRKLRVRKKVFGISAKPRLSVFRSLKYIYAQIIDDESGKTLVTVDDVVKKLHEKKTRTAAALEVGRELARRAKAKKIDKVVFDRGSYNYHGRVKSLADGAREEGLVF
ncbi:MAG: 50S ribosomal protein L18 [Patescibacteria group bacterium]|jgi:large subunit ribosomal protein L18